MAEQENKIVVEKVDFFYGHRQVLDCVSAVFQDRTITAITGASGEGKSTFLGLFNCMWNEIPGARCTGGVRIRIDGSWISPLHDDIPRPLLRRKVAMIFQEPNPLPMSIFKNMAFPLKLAGEKIHTPVEERIQSALKRAFLWEEVKDRLNKSALTLSGGQRQRLCIARALVSEPEVILCDEPTSSLDSKAAGIIEELLVSLKAHCSLLVVSHYMDQVRRMADRTMVLENRRLSEG